MRTLISSVVKVIVVLLLATAASAQPVQKKLIATGWDNPTPAQLRRDLAEMDKRPFDGVVIQVTAHGAGAAEGSMPFGSAFGDKPWKEQWFAEAIADLKAVAEAKPKRLTDNFAIFNANPGNVDFFDDAGWKQIADHCRIAARVARQGGLKGLLFDPEPYAQPSSQFSYRAQPQRQQHSFKEYWAKSRQRGREVMKAMAEEFPDMALMTYFMHSVNSAASGIHDPQRLLASSGYGLYAPFIEGWLDAAPMTMTLIDGCESAYLYNSDRAFERAATIMKVGGQDLVTPENRGKYRALVQAGFGIYLDAYANPKGSPWYIDGAGGPRASRLEANVGAALRCADQYVWIYGEKGRWWPGRDGAKPEKYEPWPVVLPECEQALMFARDPAAATMALLDSMGKAGKLQNLLQNGDFAQSPAGKGPIPGWGAWQDEKSPRGKMSLEEGAARLTNVTQGCFTQSIPAEPGQRFAIRARARFDGPEPSIRIRWNDGQKKWIHEDRDAMVYGAMAADAKPGDWRPMQGTFVVPEGAAYIVVLLGVSHQNADESAWFDDVELYRVR